MVSDFSIKTTNSIIKVLKKLNYTKKSFPFDYLTILRTFSWTSVYI